MKQVKNLFLNEIFILVLIILNAIVIFIQEFDSNWPFITYLEAFFTFLFFIELVIKIKSKSLKGYLSSGWNRFDFIIIVLSLPTLLDLIIPNYLYSLNILLTFRILRVFKLFRLIKFLPNISELITSLQRALKASYLVIIGFFIISFMVSLITCALYKSIAPEYFGDPLRSFYSVFQLFSVDGWYEIPNLISERSNDFIAFISKSYFIILLLCGGILGLSLINSIFVDAMVSDNNDDVKVELEQISKKIDLINKKIDSKTNN